MPQLLAVAYASFEESFASGAEESRGKVLKFLVQQEVLKTLPPDGNPFGTDPALLASIGRGDTTQYTATAPLHRTDQVDETLPEAPLNAAGQR